MAALALIALSAWAFSSPVGSSPDDDFHLASIWCSATAPSGSCTRHGADVTVPRWTVAAARCFAFRNTIPASCQSTAGLSGAGSTSAARANIPWTYPPGFYLAMGVLAGDDVPASVYAMRVANAAIVVAILLLALGLAPPAVRQSGLLALLAVGGPLGWFLFASTNPSSWAVAGMLALTVALLGALLEPDDRRALLLLVVAAAGWILCIASRADAAAYAAVIALGIAIAALLRPEAGRRRRIVFALVCAVAIVGALVVTATAGQAHIGMGGGGAGRSAMPLGGDVRNVINLPYLLLGSIGFWGVGWLDTTFPQGLPILATLLLGGVLMLGLGRLPRWIAPAVVLGVGALVVLPMRVLHARGYSVGEFVQPRYMLPLLIACVVLVLAPPTARGVLALSRLQAAATVAIVFAVYAVGLVVNAQRYATGMGAAKFDISSSALWWSTDRISPNQTVALGILACAGFLALAWRYLRPAG